MKLTVTQENLTKALATIGRVASARTELPILNNILLRTDGGRLLIAATNLEIAATQYIGAKIDAPGSITVPAKLISEFVASLPSGTITIEVKDTHLHLTAGKFSSIIHGLAADEFPELPTVDEHKAVTIELTTDEFKKAVSQTVIATSGDPTRAVLTGVNWYSLDGELYLAATDGYRLAEKSLGKTNDEIAAIIPASTLQEVLRSLHDGVSTVTVHFDEAQVSFMMPELEIVSRLIDGKFPDYRQLIPANSETVVVLQKADFSRVVKIASLFARDSGGGISLTASQEHGLLSVHSIASELGENTSEAAAEVSHDGVVTLNSRYLIEALNALDGDTVEFSFNGKLAPCILRQHAKATDYKHVIMPLKR
ncbi:MAG: DNA polymerase III subunit beta [Candidatus Saccharibacteria bacterium]|nr:DNA polymerase III subunit beta [Candidatus Saccharibacteria bacterium]